MADEIVVINGGPRGAGRHTGRALRRNGQRVRHAFLGPVTQFGSDLVRPHDLGLLRPDRRRRAGTVTRLLRVGFEVRRDRHRGRHRARHPHPDAGPPPRTRAGALAWVRVEPSAHTFALTQAGADAETVA